MGIRRARRVPSRDDRAAGTRHDRAPEAQGKCRRVPSPGAAESADPQVLGPHRVPRTVRRLRLRRDRQPRQGTMDAAAGRDHRRRVRRVLQAHRARHRGAADVEPQPRRREARVHELAVRSLGRAVRPLESRIAEGREAVRAASVHYGSGHAVPAAVSAFHPRRRRFERADVERFARAAAARRSDRSHARRADAARARYARAPGRRRREVQEVLERVWLAREGGARRGLREP